MADKRKALAQAAAAALILGAAWYFNRSGLFDATLERLDALGPMAPAAFLALYVLTCVFFVPSFLFTFAAGILFGLWKGLFLSVLGTGLGSVCAFMIGRHLARGYVSSYFGKRPEFMQIDRAVSRKGWKIVLLARLSPIFPFLVGNYAFGLTAIPARDYFLASMAGTVPSSAVYVYIGTVTGSLAALNSGRARTPAEWGLLLAGLAATVVLAVYLRKTAMKALEKEIPSEGER